MFEKTSLSSLDVAVFGASLGVSMLIGLYFANKNKTFKEYTTGGGKQSLWPVATSMAACYTGSLTMTGNPSELYLHGPSLAISFVATIICWPITAFVFLPVFKRIDSVSVFNYVEKRFSPTLRRFVSLVFILMMTLYSAVSLYIPSLSLYAALAIPKMISIGLVGGICIVYCTLGGIKAVVWTNLFHCSLICLSLVAIIMAGSISNGGLYETLRVASEGGRLSMENYFNFDITTRHTLYNMLFGFTLMRCFLHGLSQMQVQLALSLSTLKRSQLSMLLSAIIFIFIQFIASAVGLVIYGRFKECDPFVYGQIERRDELMLHYLTKHLKFIPAIQGLFIAAVFSSTLTSMSAFQSSMSAMLVEDFIRPFFAHHRKQILDDNLGATLGKLSAFIFGLVCILLTILVDKLDGLMQVSMTIFGTFGTPILAVFSMGVLTRFTNTKGMFAGLLASLSFGLYVQFMQTFFQQSTNEPTLPISIAGCLLNGELSSRSNLSSASNQTSTFVVKLETIEEEVLSDYLNVQQMSYFWLPFFVMLVAISVSSAISLLTGGLNQHVDDKYLATFLCSSSPEGEQLKGKCVESCGTTSSETSRQKKCVS